ncbi:dTDP-4-dehydrorhamnose reductase family protein [Legionella longbeachae]|uniref:dTDP-4-dehydrorhamnose reductase family protein n=1 Tax=Legionella longbeachae TaxID=450 RepID=UPI00124487EB|nr:SDR family oxidoreductase [Legionella longbeachae]QEY50105.1 SDR family oxidoreductase [Legionella longbeachae]QEY50235.1 SDR family oxidoreductase [Legionella longbeachae]
MKILVLGITGMLGSAVFHTFNQQQNDFEVWGTLRSREGLNYFPNGVHPYLISDTDVLNLDALCKVLEQVRPNVVINCVGLIKQLSSAKDPLSALPVNAMLPHQLARLCQLAGARLIHISTDCVFSGKKGFYAENDNSDAEDLYGKSKFIGEITESSNAITLRTSIIGHEFNSKSALVEWFLSQELSVKGYVNAIFSGLPTFELARVMRDYVIPKPELSGLYHVAATPINKYELLSLIAEVYKKNINIIADEELRIDRSLNGERFKNATGYVAPDWPQLIALMHKSKNLYEDK